MDRGLFFQLGSLSPARFAELAEEVALAETLGLDAVWCLPMTGEDGGFRGGAPAIWLAGLAGTTKSIRLGWGVPGVWPPEIPPVREAEQAATLDPTLSMPWGQLVIAYGKEGQTGRAYLARAELASASLVGGHGAAQRAHEERRRIGIADRVLLDHRFERRVAGNHRRVPIARQRVALVGQCPGKNQPQPVEQREIERAPLVLFLMAR